MFAAIVNRNRRLRAGWRLEAHVVGRRPDGAARRGAPLCARATRPAVPDARHRARDRPHPAQADGRARPDRCRPARGLRRPRRKRCHVGPHHRSDRGGRLQRQLRAVARLADGNDRASEREPRTRAPLEHTPRRRRSHHGARSHRTRRWLGRGEPEAQGAARRRPLHPQRREDVDLVRRPGGLDRRLRAHRHTRGGSAWRQRVPRPARSAR